MARLSVWVWTTLALIGVSIAFSVLALSAVNMNFMTIFLMSSVVMLMLGTTFLVAFWMSTWLNSPRFNSAHRNLHDARMQRHELNRLYGELSKRERDIEELEMVIRKMQEREIRQTLPLPPPPPPPTPQHHTATGVFRAQGEPSRHTTYAPSRRTGMNDVVRDTGEYPTVPSQPVRPDIREEEETALYTAVGYTNGNHRHVARRGNSRNGHYHR